MVGTGLLVVFLLIASYTDVRRRIILNSTTYTGIVVAFGVSAFATLAGIDRATGTPRDAAWWGLVPFWDSLAGCAACGAAMLVCYVVFAGGVGGGDLKLIAMMGSFLGLYQGLEAMLWTMIIGGCLAVIVLIWRVGFWRLLGQAARAFWAAARGRLPDWSDDDRRALKTELFLSPSALVAVLIVRLDMAHWW